jgi:hypothetical protein
VPHRDLIEILDAVDSGDTTARDAAVELLRARYTYRRDDLAIPAVDVAIPALATLAVADALHEQNELYLQTESRRIAGL